MVRVLDKKKTVSAGADKPVIEFIEGGIEDRETVQNAMHGVDVVYHLADTFSSDPYEVLDIDIRGNINLLEAALQYEVKHFLFASTYRVYGKPESQPIDENHRLKPEESGRALYATVKLANEKLCLRYWQEMRLPVTIFRFWWSFGQEIGGKALRTLIDTALQGSIIRVPEQGGGNFLTHDDAMSAFRQATLNEKAYGEAMNLSSGVFTTWRDLADLVRELTESPSRIEIIANEEWQGDASLGMDRSIPYAGDLDIGKAGRLTGYRPGSTPEEVKKRLRDALDRLVQARRAAGGK
jgi:UDP-glucose 4-epimerase